MKSILVIEDNLDVRENIAEILELANYRVLTAENGKQGVEQAKDSKPDLIICDVMMPELDGYGVLHVLSKSEDTASIPFIFLTAKTEKSDIKEVSWDELYLKVAALSKFMKERGIKKGDCVVAYMGNISETVVAFLACASLGAIWSSCSPDFGSDSVIERFKQIKPKMLFAVNSYGYERQFGYFDNGNNYSFNLNEGTVIDYLKTLNYNHKELIELEKEEPKLFGKTDNYNQKIRFENSFREEDDFISQNFYDLRTKKILEE